MDDALQTSTVDDINDACEEEGERLFDYTKSLLEKNKIEEVATAMESNELPSKLNYANLSSLSLSEENVAPNSEVKLPRSTRNARLITDTKLRGVSPVKSPIKKKTLQPVLHTPLSSPLKSSPLKSIQLNRIVASPNKKVSTAKTKLFEENSLKLNTTPVKLATTPKKSQ